MLSPCGLPPPPGRTHFALRGVPCAAVLADDELPLAVVTLEVTSMEEHMVPALGLAAGAREFSGELALIQQRSWWVGRSGHWHWGQTP